MTIAADPLGVYACRNGTVTCVDPMTGQILWSLKPPGAGSALPVVATMLGGGEAGHSSQVAAAAAAQAAQAAAAASG
jgi:outer membrane protein assembly factor BamB